MYRLCDECKQPFEVEHPDMILCAACCKLEDHEICFEALGLGEGSVECHIARKDHRPPHFWEGPIGDAQVRIEWTRRI
jgi:hypothetical protein